MYAAAVCVGHPKLTVGIVKRLGALGARTVAVARVFKAAAHIPAAFVNWVQNTLHPWSCAHEYNVGAAQDHRLVSVCFGLCQTACRVGEDWERAHVLVVGIGCGRVGVLRGELALLILMTTFLCNLMPCIVAGARPVDTLVWRIAKRSYCFALIRVKAFQLGISICCGGRVLAAVKLTIRVCFGKPLRRGHWHSAHRLVSPGRHLRPFLQPVARIVAVVVGNLYQFRDGLGILALVRRVNVAGVHVVERGRVLGKVVVWLARDRGRRDCTRVLHREQLGNSTDARRIAT